jgi:hypothetical protein
MSWKYILKAPIWEAPNISPDARIWAASIKMPDLKGMVFPQSDKAMKPRGVWYGFGDNWLMKIEENYPAFSNRYKYVFEIEVTGNILKLETEEEHKEFYKKYGTEDITYRIDWPVVKDHYDGIEVMGGALHGKSLWDDDLDWLFTWEIDSGCIWNMNSFKIVKKIFDNEDPKWEQVEE